MRNSFLKQSFVEKVSVVDSETGEILNESINKTNFLANTKEQFCLMYSSLMLFYLNSSLTEVKLFSALIMRYANGMSFSLGRGMRDEISQEANCSSRSLDNALTNLIKEKYIIKIGRNHFKINPRHVFKGSTNERDSQLKAVLELHCKDC